MATPGNQSGQGSRSSERLHKRYSRSFRMPSRDSIWKDIPTTPTSAIGRLKPLRNVHNLSRITHRYNQDCYNSDDEGDSGSDNFVVPDRDESEDDISSDGEEESDVEKNKHGKEHRSTGRHHRVRGYHNKIFNPASSSSDSDNEVTNSSVRNRNCETRSHLDDKESEGHDDNHSDISESGGKSKQSGECESRSQNDPDDDELQISSSSRKRRRSRIQSSSDSDQSSEPSAKGKQLFVESEIKSGNGSKCFEAGDVTLNSQQSTTETPACSKRTKDESSPNHGSSPKDTGVNMSENSATESEIHSDDDSTCTSVNTSDSGSSGCDSGHDGHFDLDNIKSSRARHQIQKQESEKKKKFEAFLEARRKLSASKKK
ncbi:dentin sialophosphoprotein-like isoform X2 [Argopecten irradians]|uniref:dentin sialophosphoprotein-like isoform X2 n=1 Tax=Argopecten irradians TaxID=31199 RepID=UPI0037120470